LEEYLNNEAHDKNFCFIVILFLNILSVLSFEKKA
jgi:hypothetical protein